MAACHHLGALGAEKTDYVRNALGLTNSKKKERTRLAIAREEF